MKRKELPARDGLLEITKYIKSDAIAKEIHRTNGFISSRMNHRKMSGKITRYNFSQDTIDLLNAALAELSTKISMLHLPEHKGNEENFASVMNSVLMYVQPSHLWVKLGYTDKRRWHERVSPNDKRYSFKLEEIDTMNKALKDISRKLALIFLVYQE